MDFGNETSTPNFARFSRNKTRSYKFVILEKYIKTVNLEELLDIFPNILKGEITGRVLVDLNK